MTERIKSLFRNLAIYGLGDVATSFVSLLLLPVYTRYLTPSDYGIIAMLLTVEAGTKILFRWGVDTAFMRLYYDCTNQRARQLLASTIVCFLFVANGTLLVAALTSATSLSTLVFGTAEQALLVALMLCNTFVAGFFFIPFQVLRIGERSGQFIALSFSRSAGTLVARLVLVVGAEMGVLGVVLADVLVTAVFSLVISRWYVPLLRPVFSRRILREALSFGLPRVPHSIAHQVMGLADRYFLNAYATLRDVGLYSIGATFGLTLKLFLAAFEYAWTPFFLGVMHEPDAKHIYSTVSTYVVALVILLGAGLCAVAPDLVQLATMPEFHEAAMVTPWIALGVVFQGLYLVGSIGLVITKRTKRYPVATGTAAAVSLIANAVLVPRFGLMGAAWANTLAYATLATVTVALSYDVYPIPYEWTRLLRSIVAGGVGFVISGAVPASTSPWVGLPMRGVLTVAAFVGVLALTGFFRAGELRWLRDIGRRAWTRRTLRAPDPDSAAVEMAGEIIAAAPDPNAVSVEVSSPDDAAFEVTRDSRNDQR